MGAIVYIFSLFLLLGCGSQLPTTYGDSKAEVQGGGKAQDSGLRKLEGRFQLLDGSHFDLATLDRPSVVIFATYFCISCQQEALAMSQYFLSRGLPKNVAIYTILAGSSLERSRKWATKYGVNWNMGSDPNGTLFESFCPEKLTPCVLTQNLNLTPPVSKHMGVTSLDLLEKETGPWVF